MKQCKHCKEDIEKLGVIRLLSESGVYTLNDGFDISDSQEERIKFICPSCDRVLARNEAEADKVLGAE